MKSSSATHRVATPWKAWWYKERSDPLANLHTVGQGGCRAQASHFWDERREQACGAEYEDVQASVCVQCPYAGRSPLGGHWTLQCAPGLQGSDGLFYRTRPGRRHGD